MKIAGNTSNPRATTVAFVQCFDGATFGRAVHMTASEGRRLRGLLAALTDYGFILGASVEPAEPDYGFEDVVEHLRGTMGPDIVDAALASTHRGPLAATPAAAALMPVSTFEPEDGTNDVLVSSTQLWGANLLVEALRVDGEENAVPVPAVRDRFARWAAASGAGRPMSTTWLPGHDGYYVIFAAAGPA